MRPLLLALPLLALATACAEPCTAPALTMAWRFDLADGTRDASCAGAGVATVDLWLDGEAAGLGMACAQGAATFAGLAAGSHTFTIQGRAATGQLLYQEWGLAELGACGETRVTSRPGAGYLRIGYSTPGGLCHDPSDPTMTPGYVWYQLQDSLGATVSVVNASQSPTALECQTPAGQPEVNLTLPYGLYTLRWIQVVSHPTTSPLATYQHCVPSAVATLRAPLYTTLPVALELAGGAPCIP